LILQYERELMRAFQEYGTRIENGLHTGRALETTPPPMPIIPGQFAQVLQSINQWTLFLIDKIILEYTEKGYLRGVTFAQKQLKPYRIEVAFNMPYDPQVLEAIRTRNHSVLKGVTEAASAKIMQEVTTGSLNGETVDQIARRIRKSVDTISIPRSRTIARTELMKAVNQGVRNRFASSGVEYVQRLETQDERTCTDHVFHVGGKTYRGCWALVGHNFTLAEAAEIEEQTHPNCRGSFKPVFEGLSQTTIRVKAKT
jgi:hypothetical protein